MLISEIRQKYLDFFKAKGHAILPSASLIPENDPTTLFTGSGMQPILPYLLGEPHPQGKRISDSQKCFRTQDIEEVGDNRHTTFFEMLGNWSLGDYFKKEQLSWIFDFLTIEVNLDPTRLYFTAFTGSEDQGIPRDAETVEVLKEILEKKRLNSGVVELITIENAGRIGMLAENGSQGRIFYYDAKKNWWSRAGEPKNMPVGEPGGPDCEIFYDFAPEAGLKCIKPGFGDFCHPNCDCGRFMEIGNSVFMEYQKTQQGFEKLPQKNVDFGGGLERITAASANDNDIFKLDIFSPIIRELESVSGRFYADDAAKDDKNDLKKSFRIVAEHLRSAAFLISDGAVPSNTDQGYFTRRLIRRAVRHLDLLGIKSNTLAKLAKPIIDKYKDAYPSLGGKGSMIEEEIENEENKFRKTLEVGLKEFNKLSDRWFSDFEVAGDKDIKLDKIISGADAFLLFSTYGLPIDLLQDLASEKGLSIDTGAFEKERGKHQEISRAGILKKFKGGLADTTDMSVKYHTATHLLHQALRDVLGDEVRQKGSNITPDRLRFDFSFARKMTDDEKARVEIIVNDNIKKDIEVNRIILPKNEAEKSGALHFFGEKYGDDVSVYFIGESLESAYSKEFCGGPHVDHTGVLGKFKIIKEEAVSAGVRRIKAVLSESQ